MKRWLQSQVFLMAAVLMMIIGSLLPGLAQNAPAAHVQPTIETPVTNPVFDVEAHGIPKFVEADYIDRAAEVFQRYRAPGLTWIWRLGRGERGMPTHQLAKEAGSPLVATARIGSSWTRLIDLSRLGAKDWRARIGQGRRQ